MTTPRRVTRSFLAKLNTPEPASSNDIGTKSSSSARKSSKKLESPVATQNPKRKSEPVPSSASNRKKSAKETEKPIAAPKTPARKSDRVSSASSSGSVKRSTKKTKSPELVPVTPAKNLETETRSLSSRKKSVKKAEVPVRAPKTPVVAPKTPVVAPKTPVVAPKTPVVAPKTPVVAPKTPVVALKTPAEKAEFKTPVSISRRQSSRKTINKESFSAPLNENAAPIQLTSITSRRLTDVMPKTPVGGRKRKATAPETDKDETGPRSAKVNKKALEATETFVPSPKKSPGLVEKSTEPAVSEPMKIDPVDQDPQLVASDDVKTDNEIPSNEEIVSSELSRPSIFNISVVDEKVEDNKVESVSRPSIFNISVVDEKVKETEVEPVSRPDLVVESTEPAVSEPMEIDPVDQDSQLVASDDVETDNEVPVDKDTQLVPSGVVKTDNEEIVSSEPSRPSIFNIFVADEKVEENKVEPHSRPSIFNISVADEPINQNVKTQDPMIAVDDNGFEPETPEPETKAKTSARPSIFNISIADEALTLPQETTEVNATISKIFLTEADKTMTGEQEIEEKMDPLNETFENQTNPNMSLEFAECKKLSPEPKLQKEDNFEEPAPAAEVTENQETALEFLPKVEESIQHDTINAPVMVEEKLGEDEEMDECPVKEDEIITILDTPASKKSKISIIEILDTPISPKITLRRKVPKQKPLDESLVVDQSLMEGSILKRRTRRSKSTGALDSTMVHANRKVKFNSPANTTININDIDERLKQQYTVASERDLRVSRRKRSMSTADAENFKQFKSRKMPNFAAIHNKQIQEMESIVDYKRRVQEKAEEAKASSEKKKIPRSTSKSPSRIVKPKMAAQIKFNFDTAKNESDEHQPSTMNVDDNQSLIQMDLEENIESTLKNDNDEPKLSIMNEEENENDDESVILVNLEENIVSTSEATNESVQVLREIQISAVESRSEQVTEPTEVLQPARVALNASFTCDSPSSTAKLPVAEQTLKDENDIISTPVKVVPEVSVEAENTENLGPTTSSSSLCKKPVSVTFGKKFGFGFADTKQGINFNAVSSSSDTKSSRPLHRPAQLKAVVSAPVSRKIQNDSENRHKSMYKAIRSCNSAPKVEMKGVRLNKRFHLMMQYRQNVDKES